MLFVSSSGHGKRTKLDKFNRQGRGGQGVRGMKVTASRGEVVAAFTVAPDDEILVFSSGGNIIRMGVSEISSQGRDATGVRVARLADGETVVAVAPVLEADAAETEADDRRPRPVARDRATSSRMRPTPATTPVPAPRDAETRRARTADDGRSVRARHAAAVEPTRAPKRAPRSAGRARRPSTERRYRQTIDQGRPVVGAQDLGVLLHLRHGRHHGGAASRCG